MSLILVAEQDAGYAEQIAETLKSEGWSVELVASRDAAFRIAATSKPSLLLASATLPESSSLLAAFSRQRGGPGAVVLVPTALAGRATAADFQADLVLSRPCSDDELRATVRSCLQLSGQSAQPSIAPLQAGDQQLTSADIFGDVLAEVEAEATRARRASSKARRQAANSEIDRKLEETLSGVFPVGEVSKPKTASSPAKTPEPSPVETIEAALSASRTPKKSKRKVEIPTDSEIDDLLDKTLSSLELPKRGRKTANRPRPESPKTKPTPSAEPPPVAAPRPAEPAAQVTPSPAAAPPTPFVTPAAQLQKEEPSDLFEPLPSLDPPEALEQDSAFEPPPALDPPQVLEAPPAFESPPALDPPPQVLGATGQGPTGQVSVAPPAATEPSIFSTTPMLGLGESLSPPASQDVGEETNPWQAPDALPSAPETGFSGSDAFSTEGNDPWSELRGIGSPETFGNRERDIISSGFNTLETPRKSPSASSEDVGDSTNPWQSIDPPADLFPPSFADASSSGFPRPNLSAPPPSQSEKAIETPISSSSTELEPPPALADAVPKDPLANSEVLSSEVFSSEALPSEALSSEPPDPIQAEPLPPAPSAAPSEDTSQDTALDRFRSFLDQVETPTNESTAPPTPSAPAAASTSPAPDLSTGPTPDLGTDTGSFAPPPIAAQQETSLEGTGVEGPESALQGVLELRGETESTAVSEVPAGQPFGDYTLLERIAVGGMAEVWRARRSGVEGFQKTVAIKKILSHLTDSPDFVNMFIDEAKLAAQLTHNNIIQIYDLGKVDDDFFIAMEYVDGRDLRTILKKSLSLEKPLPMHLALMIVAALARALDYAHRKKGFDERALGLVHRDVSPQNVLISYEGEIKLCDFGIVKAVAKASTTQMGALKGKLQYMSPEQAWGKSVDARSDIFSLGSVLFEVLTGEKLFIGDSEIGVLDAVRECRIRSLHDMLPDLPPKVDSIVRKALEKDATDRYQTAGEMDRDIQEVLRQLRPDGDSKDLAAFMAALFRPMLEAPQLEPMGDGSASFALPPKAEGSSSFLPPATTEPADSNSSVPASPPATPVAVSSGNLKKILLGLVIALVLAGLTAWALKTKKSEPAPTTPTAAPTSGAATTGAATTGPATTGPATTGPATTGSATELPANEAKEDATATDGTTSPPPDQGTGDSADDDPALTFPGEGSSSSDPTADGGDEALDIENLVKEGLDAQQSELQERLASEFEAKKRELEAKLAETQQQNEDSEPPPDND